jgi:hypothetical protein
MAFGYGGIVKLWTPSSVSVIVFHINTIRIKMDEKGVYL